MQSKIGVTVLFFAQLCDPQGFNYKPYKLEIRTTNSLKKNCLHWNIKAVQQNWHLPCIENYFSQTGIKIMKKKINEFAACAVRLLYLKSDVFFSAFK